MSIFTKEERFILKIYTANKDNIENPINRYHIGALMGLSPKGTDAICKILVRANFIKKSEEDTIYLTKQGIELAERLQG